jgi:tRNA pseudouridine(55) synthase
MIGETPLEALFRLKKRNKKYRNEKLSYIGRLDPMAEGKMLVLIGEENKNRDKYLNFDKEYEARFVIGLCTDSGDVLGLIRRFGSDDFLLSTNISKAILSLKNLKMQKYPWLSGKTINGVKMFELFKKGLIENIEIPEHQVKIKQIFDIKVSKVSVSKMKKDIFKRINTVSGDFRQNDIKKEWLKFFKKNSNKFLQKFSFKVRVSSGTFIRGFCEELEGKFGQPVFLYHLKRTKIFVKI